MKIGTVVVVSETIFACGQGCSESGLKVNKTFSKAWLSRVWPTGAGRDLSRLATRKRSVANRGDEAKTRDAPALLFSQKRVTCVMFGVGKWRGQARAQSPGNRRRDSPFPFRGSGEVCDFKYFGLGLREKEEKKETELQGDDAETRT